ncbi:tyrosine-type recombinase/integrase [Streptomyces sp. NPDC057539]|uniref:tyrosine-type recombinase/integrase n=1 Tax=Streptomyces sp. NPDC057539 TaxID=3346159 RepID=UPI0036B28611
MFALALHTGLREGELLGLRREDLDLADGTASIRRPLQRTNSGGLTALPTKTQSSERRMALPTPWLRSLEQHRTQRHQERERQAQAGRTATTSSLGPRSPDRRGHPLPALHRPAPPGRLRRIRFHDLRHSGASHITVVAALPDNYRRDKAWYQSCRGHALAGAGEPEQVLTASLATVPEAAVVWRPHAWNELHTTAAVLLRNGTREGRDLADALKSHD